MTTGTSAVISSSNSSSTTVMTSLSPPISFSQFGDIPSPLTGSPLSFTSGNLSRTFGSSSAASGSTGSGIFGFSSSALSTVNNRSQGSVFGTTSGFVIGSLAPPATSVFATSVQSQWVGSGSAAPTPLFGSTMNPAFSSARSSFPSSSTATNILRSGTTFGRSYPASSSEANPVSSVSGTTFGLSSWQPSKARFGSAFSSSTSSTSGFTLGRSTSSPMMFGSSTTVSSGPRFSFASAAATSNVQFTLGSPSQQNIGPQSPSPFQASGSVEFNAGGGGFTLGSGGGRKSGRQCVKVKRKLRKK